jgi:hypothetical protein
MWHGKICDNQLRQASDWAFSLHFREPHLLSGDGRRDRAWQGGFESLAWRMGSGCEGRGGKIQATPFLSKHRNWQWLECNLRKLLQPNFRLECAPWWCERRTTEDRGPLRNAAKHTDFCAATHAPTVAGQRQVLCTASPCPALFGSSCGSGIAWKNGLLLERTTTLVNGASHHCRYGMVKGCGKVRGGFAPGCHQSGTFGASG